MKEILTWGNCLPNFKRLGINPKETWHGYGWRKDDEMNVYELTEEEFKTLCDDEESYNSWQNACWRYTEGSNLGAPNTRYSVNGHWIYGWHKRGYDTQYKHLLEYLCQEIGVSTETNVTACAMDLARYNNLSLAELFKKYQG